MRRCHSKWSTFRAFPFIDTFVLGEDEFDMDRNNPNISIQEEYNDFAGTLQNHIQKCLGEYGPRSLPLFAVQVSSAEGGEAEGEHDNPQTKGIGTYEDLIEYRLPTLYLSAGEMNKIGTLHKITQNCLQILGAIEEKVVDLQAGLKNGTASRRQDASLRKLYHSLGCYSSITQIVMQTVDLMLRRKVGGDPKTMKFLTRLQTFTERFANKIKENEWAEVMKLFGPVIKDIQQQM